MVPTGGNITLKCVTNDNTMINWIYEGSLEMSSNVEKVGMDSLRVTNAISKSGGQYECYETGEGTSPLVGKVQLRIIRTLYHHLKKYISYIITSNVGN